MFTRASECYLTTMANVQFFNHFHTAGFVNESSSWRGNNMAAHASACLGLCMVFVCTRLKRSLHIFKFTIKSWCNLKLWEYSTLAKLNQSLALLDKDNFKDNHLLFQQAFHNQQLSDSELMLLGSHTVLGMCPARSLPPRYTEWDWDMQNLPSSGDGAFPRAPQRCMRCLFCPPSTNCLPGLGSTSAVRKKSFHHLLCLEFTSISNSPRKIPFCSYICAAINLKVCGITQKGII